MFKVFIVEDDPGITSAITELCESWELQPVAVTDFRNVAAEFAAASPHIVLLDITLPCYNGYHWCEEIRKISNVPIIFISSASDNMSMVMAMNMGADDFIAKPFDRELLVAKIQAVLRRTYNYSAAASRVLQHRGAFLNTGAGSMTFGDQKIELTKNELRILSCLMENKGKTVSREKLMERLWETDLYVDENTLTVNVNRLRKKLDAAGLEGFITTKFGVGYMIG